MDIRRLPPEGEMWTAFVARDSSYDGLFFTGVHTTGVFCRTTCSARKPLRENVTFFGDASEALTAGYRPCLRCRPLEPSGAAPAWLRPLLQAVEEDPARRWTDRDVSARGLNPQRVRRWFIRTHGMTFHAYSRARRLGAALGRVRGGDSVGRAAMEAGYDSLSGFQEAFRSYFGDSPTRLEGAPVVHVERVVTPLGPMLVGATEGEVALMEFADRRMLPNQVRRLVRRLGAVFVPEGNALTSRAGAELAAYFEGDLRRFDLPLRPCGTAFQAEVWRALGEIPYGETISYRELAVRVGRAAAVRAVAGANGANALAVVVPCHRVIASDGTLSGYGGGVWRKRWLLDLERRVAAGD